MNPIASKTVLKPAKERKIIQITDVIIVGAGPAGLNAALVLGRCRRTVLLFDDGKPRNAASRALHGFLTRDGIPPAELRRIGRAQLMPYDSVTVIEASVVDAARKENGFAVQTSEGETFVARKLLLAAGVVDALPRIPGFDELYGAGVFHCPYCDGWEVRDQPLAVYGRGDDKGGGLALELTLWSRDVVLCTDGPSGLSPACRERLARCGIPIREERILRLDRTSRLATEISFDIVFERGDRLARRALFFNTGRRQSSDLAKRLGCEMYESTGCKINNQYQAAGVPGLYVAGDASRDVLQAIVAASEGAQAAIAINTALLKEDLP